MSLNVYVVTTVTCDHCEVEMDDGIVSNRRQTRQARQAARNSGWTHPTANTDYCPDCTRLWRLT